MINELKKKDGSVDPGPRNQKRAGGMKQGIDAESLLGLWSSRNPKAVLEWITGRLEQVEELNEEQMGLIGITVYNFIQKDITGAAISALAEGRMRSELVESYIMFAGQEDIDQAKDFFLCLRIPKIASVVRPYWRWRCPGRLRSAPKIMRCQKLLPSPRTIQLVDELPDGQIRDASIQSIISRLGMDSRLDYRRLAELTTTMQDRGQKSDAATRLLALWQHIGKERSGVGKIPSSKIARIFQGSCWN